MRFSVQRVAISYNCWSVYRWPSLVAKCHLIREPASSPTHTSPSPTITLLTPPKFGGDPNHVVIGGDSAGGASIDLHLSAYGGRDDGLFHAAAAESQSFAQQSTVAQAQYQYDALVARVGCANSSTISSLSCLRALPIATLQGANINIPTPGGGPGAPLFMYSTVIDGTFSRDFTYAEFARGNFIKVPVIFGDPTNDGTQFVYKNTSSVQAMNTFLKNQFSRLNDTHLEKIDELYPKAEQFPNSGAYWRAASNAYGEMRYVCPGIKLNDAYDKYNVTGNWNYRYVSPPPYAMNFPTSTHLHQITLPTSSSPKSTSQILARETLTSLAST